MSIIKLTWNVSIQNQGNKIKWSDNPFTWNEVIIVTEIVNLISGGSSPTDINSWLNKNIEKKKKLITLICKIEGKEFKETKEINKVTITSSQFKMIIEEVLQKQIKVTIL